MEMVKRKIKTLGLIYNSTSLEAEFNVIHAFENLIKYLKIGKYFFNVLDNKEIGAQMIMIYNISLKDLLSIFYRYRQHTLIFVNMTSEVVSCQHWSVARDSDASELLNEEKFLIEESNNSYFYLNVCNAIKPLGHFFEEINNVSELFECKSDKYNIDKLIEESINDVFTGRHKYICRCKLWNEKNISLNNIKPK